VDIFFNFAEQGPDQPILKQARPHDYGLVLVQKPKPLETEVLVQDSFITLSFKVEKHVNNKSCKDMRPDCLLLAKQNWCRKFARFMLKADWCPESCQACDTVIGNTTVTDPPNRVTNAYAIKIVVPTHIAKDLITSSVRDVQISSNDPIYWKVDKIVGAEITILLWNALQPKFSETDLTLFWVVSRKPPVLNKTETKIDVSKNSYPYKCDKFTVNEKLGTRLRLKAQLSPDMKETGFFKVHLTVSRDFDALREVIKFGSDKSVLDRFYTQNEPSQKTSSRKQASDIARFCTHPFYQTKKS
jgi:hypothetical protein